jgi:hypothetical protein
VPAYCHAGASNAGVWERGLSRSTRKRGGKAARQSRCRSSANGWCRARNRRRKGRRAISHVYRRVGAAPGQESLALARYRWVGRQPMRSNEDPRERAVVWQRNDDAQARCTRGWIEVAWPQPLWSRTDLVAVQGTSNSQTNSACWCGESMNRCGGFVR